VKKVSVIIPVFNRKEFIEETIMSVLKQDYKNIELIVVDDGSTDGSTELLKTLSKDYEFQLLAHPQNVNRGQSASINLGLRICSGEYIAILDSDDLFVPGKVRAQVTFLEERPEVGLVYGMGEAIDSNGNLLYTLLDADHIETNDPNAILLDCYFLLPQNSLVRKTIYDDVGFFDETLRSGQDHDMLIRMAEVTKFAFLPKLFFKYRRHFNSISVKGQEIRWKAAFVILRKAQKRYPYRRSTIRKRLAVINFRLGMAFFSYRKNYLEAVGRLLLAGILDPIRAIRVILRFEQVD